LTGSCLNAAPSKSDRAAFLLDFMRFDPTNPHKVPPLAPRPPRKRGQQIIPPAPPKPKPDFTPTIMAGPIDLDKIVFDPQPQASVIIPLPQQPAGAPSWRKWPVIP